MLLGVAGTAAVGILIVAGLWLVRPVSIASDGDRRVVTQNHNDSLGSQQPEQTREPPSQSDPEQLSKTGDPNEHVDRSDDSGGNDLSTNEHRSQEASDGEEESNSGEPEPSSDQEPSDRTDDNGQNEEPDEDPSNSGEPPEPFADLRDRNFVLELPSGNGLEQEFVEVAKIFEDDPTKCRLALEGLETVFGSDHTVGIEPTDDQGSRTWTVARKRFVGGNFTTDTLAVFRLKDKSLQFRWGTTDDGPSDDSRALRFCGLQIEIGSEREPCDLIAPVKAKPLRINSSEKESLVKVQLPSLPSELGLHLRLDLELHEFPEGTELSDDVAVVAEKPVTIKTFFPDDKKDDNFEGGEYPLLEVELAFISHPDHGDVFALRNFAYIPTTNTLQERATNRWLVDEGQVASVQSSLDELRKKANVHRQELDKKKNVLKVKQEAIRDSEARLADYLAKNPALNPPKTPDVPRGGKNKKVWDDYRRQQREYLPRKRRQARIDKEIKKLQKRIDDGRRIEQRLKEQLDPLLKKDMFLKNGDRLCDALEKRLNVLAVKACIGYRIYVEVGDLEFDLVVAEAAQRGKMNGTDLGSTTEAK